MTNMLRQHRKANLEIQYIFFFFFFTHVTLCVTVQEVQNNVCIVKDSSSSYRHLNGGFVRLEAK